MKRKKADLAAGRLGDLGDHAPGPDDPARKTRTNYSAERLGISSEPPEPVETRPALADQAEPTADPFKEMSFEEFEAHEDAIEQMATAQGEGGGSPTVTAAQQQAREILRDMVQESESVTSFLPPPSPVADDRGRFGLTRTVKMRIAAGFGAALIVVLVWSVWAAIKDDAGQPERASGSRQPDPAVKPVPSGRKPAGGVPRADKKTQAWIAPPKAKPKPPKPPPKVAPKPVPKPPVTTVLRPKLKPPVPPVQKFREAPPGLQCTGIMRVPDGLVAIINGKLCRVGQRVAGAEIREIQQFVVLMELDGQRFSLGLTEQTAPPADSGGGDDE